MSLSHFLKPAWIAIWLWNSVALLRKYYFLATLVYYSKESSMYERISLLGVKWDFGPKDRAYFNYFPLILLSARAIWVKWWVVHVWEDKSRTVSSKSPKGIWILIGFGLVSHFCHLKHLVSFKFVSKVCFDLNTYSSKAYLKIHTYMYQVSLILFSWL